MMKALMLFALVIVSLTTQANPVFKSIPSTPNVTNTQDSETLSMIFAGLGLIAYIARRRLHTDY
jgi:hypothetical protein